MEFGKKDMELARTVSDALDRMYPGDIDLQIGAVAGMFIAMCDMAELDPRELLDKSLRVTGEMKAAKKQ